MTVISILYLGRQINIQELPKEYTVKVTDKQYAINDT